MPIDFQKLGDDNLNQLSLDLEIEEVEVDGLISPEEAQLRSETAKVALKERLLQDQKLLATAQEKFLSSGKVDQLPPLIEWAEDYYRLLGCGWPWRVAAYIAWASSPKFRRFPKTQQELATEFLGLTSDRQISTWRKKNIAIDQTIGLMQAAPLLDHRRDVFTALAQSAADPSHHGAQDRKTFLTMTQDYVPKQKLEFERQKVDPLDLSDEELREIQKKGGLSE